MTTTSAAGPTVRGCRGHRDDHATGADDEVHRTTNSQDLTAGNRPVGDVAVCAHLQRPQHGDVDMTAADHREARGAVEVRGAGKRGHGPLGGVDHVRVELVPDRSRPDFEQPVLGMQMDLAVGAEEPGNQIGDADPEVDDLAGPQLDRGARRYRRLRVAAHARVRTRWST